MKSLEQISIIINTYNRFDLLNRAVRSVLEQTYKNIEIIIVNDYPSQSISNGNFNGINPALIKVINNNQNLGLAQSRNIGVNNASNNIIAFLDDDDYWIDKKKLENQIMVFNENPDVEICFTNVITSKGHEINCTYPGKSMFWSNNGFIYPSTVMIKKSAILKAGAFDIRFNRGIDSDLYRRMILIQKMPFFHLDLPTTFYTILGNDSITIMADSRKYLKACKSEFLILRKYYSYFLTRPLPLLKRLKSISRNFIQYLRFK